MIKFASVTITAPSA